MIKGHTKIELFDAQTGKRDKVYEKDNLVTNAVEYLIAWQTMMGRAMNESVFPIATNALGGIMLFDSTLEESVENIHFPSNAKLVGYGDRGVILCGDRLMLSNPMLPTQVMYLCGILEPRRETEPLRQLL